MFEKYREAKSIPPKMTLASKKEKKERGKKEDLIARL